jgi:hypothetical protein
MYMDIHKYATGEYATRADRPRGSPVTRNGSERRPQAEQQLSIVIAGRTTLLGLAVEAIAECHGERDRAPEVILELRHRIDRVRRRVADGGLIKRDV